MAELRRPGRVGVRRLSGRHGRVRGGRARTGGRVGALGARVPQGITSSLSLVSDATGALSDVLELLGVRLEAVGAAAPVNQLLRPALQALEIHGTSWFTRVLGHYGKSPVSDCGPIGVASSRFGHSLLAC